MFSDLAIELIINSSKNKERELIKKFSEINQNLLAQLNKEKGEASSKLLKKDLKFFETFIDFYETFLKIKFPENKKDFHFLILDQNYLEFFSNNKIEKFGKVDEEYDFLKHQVSRDQPKTEEKLSFGNLRIKEVLKEGYTLENTVIRKAEVILK